MAMIGSAIKKDSTFEKNHSHYLTLLKNLEEISAQIGKGGGEK